MFILLPKKFPHSDNKVVLYLLEMNCNIGASRCWVKIKRERDDDDDDDDDDDTLLFNDEDLSTHSCP